jgi:hypothetical protein
VLWIKFRLWPQIVLIKSVGKLKIEQWYRNEFRLQVMVTIAVICTGWAFLILSVKTLMVTNQSYHLFACLIIFHAPNRKAILLDFFLPEYIYEITTDVHTPGSVSRVLRRSPPETIFFDGTERRTSD